MVLALRWVFVGISEQRAALALYTINWLVFITVMENVYSAVRTDSLYTADYVHLQKVKRTMWDLRFSQYC